MAIAERLFNLVLYCNYKDTGWSEIYHLPHQDWGSAAAVGADLAVRRSYLLAKGCYIVYAQLRSPDPPYPAVGLVQPFLESLQRPDTSYVWDTPNAAQTGCLWRFETLDGKHSSRFLQALADDEVHDYRWDRETITIPATPPALPGGASIQSRETLFKYVLASFRLLTCWARRAGTTPLGQPLWDLRPWSKLHYIRLGTQKIKRKFHRTSWEIIPFAYAPTFTPCGTVTGAARSCYKAPVDPYSETNANADAGLLWDVDVQPLNIGGDVPATAGAVWDVQALEFWDALPPRRIRHYIARPGANLLPYVTIFWPLSQDLEAHHDGSFPGEWTGAVNRVWQDGAELGAAPGLVPHGTASDFLGLTGWPFDKFSPTPPGMLPHCNDPANNLAPEIWWDFEVERIPPTPAELEVKFDFQVFAATGPDLVWDVVVLPVALVDGVWDVVLDPAFVPELLWDVQAEESWLPVILGELLWDVVAVETFSGVAEPMLLWDVQAEESWLPAALGEILWDLVAEESFATGALPELLWDVQAEETMLPAALGEILWDVVAEESFLDVLEPEVLWDVTADTPAPAELLWDVQAEESFVHGVNVDVLWDLVPGESMDGFPEPPLWWDVVALESFAHGVLPEVLWDVQLADNLPVEILWDVQALETWIPGAPAEVLWDVVAEESFLDVLEPEVLWDVQLADNLPVEILWDVTAEESFLDVLEPEVLWDVTAEESWATGAPAEVLWDVQAMGSAPAEVLWDVTVTPVKSADLLLDVTATESFALGALPELTWDVTATESFALGARPELSWDVTATESFARGARPELSWDVTASESWTPGSTSAGPRMAGTGENMGGVGTLSWVSVSNITADDSNYATCDGPPMAGSNTSNYLRARNFGFSIPSGSTILGIVFEFKRKIITGSTNTPTDNRVRAVKTDNTVSSTDRSAGAAWSSTESWVSFGSSTDMWGESWTYSDINHANFGVVISANNIDGSFSNPGKCRVNAVRCTVYYS